MIYQQCMNTFVSVHLCQHWFLSIFFMSANLIDKRLQYINVILFFIFLNKFIYLFSLAALGLCCCVWAFSGCGSQASHCGGFSCCRAQALGTQASVVVAHRLSSCGSRAQLLHGMWDLPGPGLEPVSPALAVGFLTTAPRGKSLMSFFFS